MEVICLQEDAFFTLMDRVYEHFKAKDGDKNDRWIDGEECMRLLKITSTTTLLKLRNEGAIRYTQPQKKIILYDRQSIDEYLDKHAKDTF